MSTNQFLAFGTAGGAPVLSNAEYAALVPANGFPAGILAKENINKALRQACVMASAVGGFIASNGQDALDDGNVPNLTLALKAALDVLYGRGGANLPVFGATYHDYTPQDSLSVALTLGIGTWLVDATASSYNSAYWAQTLSVDGNVVMSLPNNGDFDGVDVLSMGGFLVVTLAAPRAVPIAWNQESGGNSSPLYVKALALRIG